MALSSYLGKEPLGSLHDAQIRPDRGSANPFRAGARRTGRPRAYTVSIAATDPPPRAERRPDTFYAGDTPQVALAYRVYVPVRGRDVAGDTGLPRLILVGADGSRRGGRAACAAINTPDHELQTNPGYGLVLLRNMLAARGFQHAAQRVTTFGTERRVMGRYLPRARYTTPRSFAAHGCPH